MATAREIRRRIRSVKNVAQITRAVQMVASSKMRRAQDRVVASRPYSDELMRLVARLAKQAADEEDLPLMKSRAVKHVGVVVISPDRGLAGGLPGNINRRVALLATELRREAANPSLPISYVAVGRTWTRLPVTHAAAHHRRVHQSWRPASAGGRSGDCAHRHRCLYQWRG